MRRARKDYFRDLYNMDIQQQVAVPIEGFAGIQRGNYFAGEPNRGPVLVLFLFYVNVSGMRPMSSMSVTLSPWLIGSTLGDCLPFPCGV